MPRYFIYTAIGLIFLLTPDLAMAQSDLGTWITRAPIPTPRQEMPHVAVDGKIYVIGGINADRISDETVEVYDPQTDTWTTATSLPPSLHHLGASVVDNKIYVLGGYVSGFTPTNRVFAYDPETNEWSEKTAMPNARGAVVAATIDDKIYVIGGEAFGTALTTNQVYDPATDTWETRAPMPTAREHLAVATLGDKIYVIGGRVRQNGRLENLRTVEVYDPATDTWDESPANLPQTSGGLATASLNGRIYAFGGEFFEDGESGVYDMNVEYNPDTEVRLNV